MTAPHVAETPIHHFALCFLHGNCGVPKNLQIAKYLLLYQLEDERERGIRAPSGVAEEFNKLACCAQCGGEEKKLCSLCKLTRYCGQECQSLHWTSGDAPHKHACSRTITLSCKITRPDDRSLTSMSSIKVPPIRSAVREATQASIEQDEKESLAKATAGMRKFCDGKGIGGQSQSDIEKMTRNLRKMVGTMSNPMERLAMQMSTGTTGGGIMVQDSETGEWTGGEEALEQMFGADHKARGRCTWPLKWGTM